MVAQAFRPSYLQHSSRTRPLNHAGDMRRAPGINPAARPLTWLAMPFCRLVVLVAPSSRASRYATGSRLSTVASRAFAAAFGGKKREAPPYPSSMPFPCSAPPPIDITGNPSTGLRTVELFAARSFQTGRRGCQPRFRKCDFRKLPAPAALNEPYETCTRIAPKGFGPDPADGIWESAPAPPHPLCCMTAPEDAAESPAAGEFFPFAPLPRQGMK